MARANKSLDKNFQESAAVGERAGGKLEDSPRILLSVGAGIVGSPVNGGRNSIA